VLKGRLGLETARVPHADRHGLLWLEYGKLYVENGNLTFTTAGTSHLKQGSYQIPYQTVSNIFAGPGTVITHDSFRILARHGTGLIIAGAGGVRCYASMPFGPDHSDWARRQVALWADKELRMQVVRKMYSMRLGEDMPGEDINVLRGIEGMRMKEVYRQLASHYKIAWHGRRYNRKNPEGDDPVNIAINHATTAVYAAANIAVSCTSTIPQLGFIHETAGVAFPLDIADLYRAEFTLPVAFEAVKSQEQKSFKNIESTTRRLIGSRMGREKIISKMIESIKEVLGVHDNSSDT
jgi:CRISP-associated protein Cas1